MSDYVLYIEAPNVKNETLNNIKKIVQNQSLELKLFADEKLAQEWLSKIENKEHHVLTYLIGTGAKNLINITKNLYKSNPLVNIIFIKKNNEIIDIKKLFMGRINIGHHWNSVSLEALEGALKKSIQSTRQRRRYNTTLKNLRKTLVTQSPVTPVLKNYISSDQYYYKIIQSSREALIVCDLSGVIFSWSQGARDVYGYKEQYVLGKNINLLFPLKQKYNSIVDELKQGRSTITLEIKSIHETKKEIDVSYSITALKNEDKEIIGLAIFARDITDQKNYEQAQIKLRESENNTVILNKSYKFINSIIATMVDSVIVFNSKGLIQKANYATTQLLGYTENELLGKSIALITGEDVFVNKSLEALKKSPNITNQNTLYKTKSGTKIPVSYSASCLDVNDVGGETNIVAIAKDMREYMKLLSDIKRSAVLVEAAAKREMKRSHNLEKGQVAILHISEKLNRQKSKLEQTNDELTKTQDQLVQAGKMAGLGQIGAGIAHELNNPLGAVLGYIQLELSTAKPGTITHKRLSTSYEQLIRMSKIVNNIKGFARQGEREFMLIKDIKSIVTLSLDLCNDLFISSNIGLSLDIPQETPAIVADTNHLQQIFTNLLTNSKDAIEERMEKHVAKKEKYKGKVKISIRSSAKWMVIQFSDNGLGIRHENINELFNPFFTTKEAGKGTGLGLSITYGLMENHKGEIHVHSEVGKGTDFTLRFPLATSFDAQLLLKEFGIKTHANHKKTA